MNKSKTVLEILKSYKYKNTSRGIYALVDTANGSEEIPINSRAFYSIIADLYREISKGETVSPKTIKECVFNHEGTILRTQKRIDTKLRINRADDGSVIRIDLANENYEYVEITSEGWRICSDGERFFTRNASQAELPTPIRGGEIERIFDYCRIPEDKHNLFLAYIVSCFIDIIHPCLVIQGSAGSGKSTLSTFLKMLIDPCRNNAPSIFPRNETELKDVYNTNYFVGYDNLQRLNAKQSDYLCSIVTGSQVQRRKLYTDSEMCQFDLRQPILLNGISGIVTREDMLDRSIIIKLLPFEKEERRSERQIMKDFKDDLPLILGGIMDILVDVVATYEPDSLFECPRLIDFYEYGYYICEAIERGRGEDFCNEFQNAMDYQKNTFCKNDSFKEVLIGFMENEDNEWKGTVGKLSDELHSFADEFGVLDELPPTPNRLARELHLIADSLQREGLYISYSRNAKNCSVVEIRLIKEE